MIFLTLNKIKSTIRFKTIWRHPVSWKIWLIYQKMKRRNAHRRCFQSLIGLLFMIFSIFCHKMKNKLAMNQDSITKWWKLRNYHSKASKNSRLHQPKTVNMMSEYSTRQAAILLRSQSWNWTNQYHRGTMTIVNHSWGKIISNCMEYTTLRSGTWISRLRSWEQDCTSLESSEEFIWRTSKNWIKNWENWSKRWFVSNQVLTLMRKSWLIGCKMKLRGWTSKALVYQKKISKATKVTNNVNLTFNQ